MLIDIYQVRIRYVGTIINIIFCLICVSENVSHVLCFMAISSVLRIHLNSNVGIFDMENIESTA